jgi:hypothetical protein
VLPRRTTVHAEPAATPENFISYASKASKRIT